MKNIIHPDCFDSMDAAKERGIRHSGKDSVVLIWSIASYGKMAQLNERQ